LLQWSRFDEIVRQGEEYAARVIDGLPHAPNRAPETRTAPSGEGEEAMHAQPG
jgi:hypothetical protein